MGESTPELDVSGAKRTDVISFSPVASHAKLVAGSERGCQQCQQLEAVNPSVTAVSQTKTHPEDRDPKM